MSRKGFPINESSDEDCYFHWSYPDGHSDPYHVVASYTSHAADKIGANTPGWPSVKAENDYTAWSFTTEMSSCRISGSHEGDDGTVDGQYPVQYVTGVSAPEAIISGMSYCTDKATERVIRLLESRIKSQKINVMQAAVEFKKTCQTVSETAKRLAEAYSLIRGGKLGSGLGVLLGGRDNSGGSRGRNKDKTKNRYIPPNSGSAAKDWLAIQYGWRPLLSDVYGAAEELARMMTYQPPANRVTASAGYQDSTSWTRPANGIFPSSVVEVEFDATVKGVIEYSVNSQMAASAANTGITNPAAVIWELVPWSFVVDWFIPVGGYLSNLDYHNGLEFKKGHYVAKTKGTATVTPSGQPVDAAPYHLTFSGGSVRCSGTGYQRSILGGFPSVPPPHFKDPVSLEHAANAIALLRTVFGGGSDYTFAR